jgi:hypothetical protein
VSDILAMLDALDAAHAKATRGEWGVVRKGNSIQSYAIVSPSGKVCSGISPKTNNDNAIVSMHNTWPALSAAVRELAAERDAIQATLSAVESAVAEVYVHITDGKISKCDTDPTHVIAIADDVIAEEHASILEMNEGLVNDNQALLAQRERLQKLVTEPYVIAISRRECMELPIETRRQIMERQCRKMEVENG